MKVIIYAWFHGVEINVMSKKNRALLKDDQPVTNVSRYLSGDSDMEYLKNVCKILVEFRMGDLLLAVCRKCYSWEVMQEV